MNKNTLAVERKLNGDIGHNTIILILNSYVRILILHCKSYLKMVRIYCAVMNKSDIRKYLKMLYS